MARPECMNILTINRKQKWSDFKLNEKVKNLMSFKNAVSLRRCEDLNFYLDSGEDFFLDMVPKLKKFKFLFQLRKKI